MPQQSQMMNPFLQNLLPQMGQSLLSPLVQNAQNLWSQPGLNLPPFPSQPRMPETPHFRQRVGAPLLPIALGTWLSLPAVWPSLSASWTKSVLPTSAAKMPALSEPMLALMKAWLEPVRSQLPADFSAADALSLQKAITEEAFRRFEAFLAGVRAYQAYPAARGEDPSVRVVWEKGTTRLLDYAPGSSGPAILVVPSLVNRFEILDIDPEHSFLRYLVKQGFRPFVIDWQAPGEEERNFTLSDYMTQRLLPILAFAADQKGACHVLGYCMGGLLALAAALLNPTQTKTLTLMATPWDFAAAGVGGAPSASTPLGTLFVEQAEMWDSYVEKIGYLPSDFLQAIFTAFQPVQILRKFIQFAAHGSGKDDETARRFVLTEDWLNNGVPLALPVARECLRDWYKANLPARLMWAVAGQTINPREMTVPTFLLIAGKDRIVPPESALPLSGLIRGATLCQPMIGHIGLMTGDAAPHEAWAPLVAWLHGQESKAR